MLTPFQGVFLENQEFRGGQDFFGPLNGHERQQGAIWGQKS